MIFSKKFKIPFALFLICYFIFLVSSKIPAAWGVWLASKAVPGLWMGSPQGSLWRGTASAAQVDVPGQPPFALGRVDWRLSPISLLFLKPCLSFDTNLPRQIISGKVCQSLGGTSSIRDFNVDIPVAKVNAYLPLDFDGDLSAQLDKASITSDGRIKNIDGRFSWQRGRALFDGSWLTLGSFAGKVKEGPNGGAAAEIFELEGPFKVALNAELVSVKEGWKVGGTVNPQSGAPDVLVQGLQILGEDLGGGTYRVQWP